MKIEVLFPEICHLSGDPMNIDYLALCLPDAEILYTSLSEAPRFLSEEVALVYLGSVTEEGLSLVVEALTPHLDGIKAKIEDGQHILLTGNVLDAFGIEVTSDSDFFLRGLGLLPTCAHYTMLHRHNSFFLGTLGDTEIVGFKSLFGLTYPTSDDVPPLFQTVRGVGRNKDTAAEGFRLNNLMATHLTGPLLVLNPPFTSMLLRELGEEGAPLAFEEAAMQAYRTRVKEFHEEFRDPIYH